MQQLPLKKLCRVKRIKKVDYFIVLLRQPF
jgi:hypothetical protein